MTKEMKKLARQPSLDCSTLAVDKMGIQRSLSRNVNFCPGPQLRDKGYRKETGRHPKDQMQTVAAVQRFRE